MVKFRRNYKITIESSDGLLTIEPPFSIDFEVTKNTLGNAGQCVIRVYNLSQKTRDFIRKDQWSGPSDTDLLNFKTITFDAGYGNNLAQAFKGTIQQAWSVREGVDFVTEIHSYSGGDALQNAMSNVTFESSTDKRSILSTICKNTEPYGLKLGAIGNFSGSIPKAASYSGNSIDILREETGGCCVIDDNSIYLLRDNEIINARPFLVNSGTGLLGTPLRQEIYVNFDMIFEPQIRIMYPIRLQSSTDSSFNADYKVTSLRHRGMISETVCGEAITSIGCMRGEYIPVDLITG